MKRLSSREQKILIFLLCTLFLMGNFIVLSWLYQTYSELGRSLSSKQLQLHNMKLMFSQRKLWEMRDGWLNQKQPKLTDRDQAGAKLLNEIIMVGKGHDVQVENPNLAPVSDGQPTPAPTYYQAISVEVETESSWSSLIGFLHSLQQPDHFIVFEKTNLEIDPTDATKMRGKFTIAKWYAP